MIPGNVDPRRPDKVQRYKVPQSNGNAPGEDLTPDYMNILGKCLELLLLINTYLLGYVSVPNKNIARF